jgi:SAM-dependent methyltransferase
MPEFNEQYMKKRMNLAWRAPVICDMIQKVFAPQYVIDVGCGPGEIVTELRRRGIDAQGVDNSPDAGKLIERPYFNFLDATQSLGFRLKAFDLALCFEVASILHPIKHPLLAGNLSDLSNVILMTQPGNCERFLLGEGYFVDWNTNKLIRQELTPWKTKPAIKAIYNSICFRKE